VEEPPRVVDGERHRVLLGPHVSAARRYVIRGNQDAVERVRVAQRLVGEVALDLRRERVPRAHR
jgi:hypothetical protein